ncbi:MAG: hypothetical protein ACK5Z5_00390 [Neisseriaceae bacterium]
MAENIIKVVFEDNSSNGGNNSFTSATSNTSPLNDTATPSENILSSFSAKISQAVELVKSLSAQNKVNFTNLKQAASKIDPIFDPKSVKDFNKVFKDATADNASITKQFKEINKSLLEFNKQLKNTNENAKDNNSSNKNNGGNNSNTIATIAKTVAGGLPLYYATEAFRSYAATNALDSGNNLMNPLAYASQRRGLQFEQDRSIASGIGALLGGAIGSIIPGVGTAIGVGIGATAGSQIGNLGYSYFGGQDNAQDQLQYEVSQNYTNLMRGNSLSHQLASMYGNTFNKPSENMFLLPQYLQMGNMNQFGGNLSQSDLAGVAKISDRYNANPAQVGSLITQINASVKDMSATLLNVDSHAQKTGGDIVSQLAVAVQLMQKGGLSAPDAINKAFNQSLYGTTYAGAQNGYFQSSYINQFRLRTLGKVAGIDVEGMMQGDPNAIAKFNRLQSRAENNRLTPNAGNLLVNMVSQSLGLGNGVINGNPANQGTSTPYTDIFNKLSNPETVQQKNYKSLGVKNPDQDLYGETSAHNSLKSSVVDKVTSWGSGIVDKGKQYVSEGLTHVLAKEYLSNLQQMEVDKKSGNMADYQNLERLNKNLEQQIKALNKNTQPLQQKGIAGGDSYAR